MFSHHCRTSPNSLGNRALKRSHWSVEQVSREVDNLSRYFLVSRILSARRKNTHLSQLLLTSAFFTAVSSVGFPVAAVSRSEMAAPEQSLPMSRGCQSSVSLSPPRGDRTLLVRHLPAELTTEEKEDLLKYFGAQSVRVLSDKGRLVRARRSLAVREGPERVTRRVGALTGRRQKGGRRAFVVGGFPLFYQTI